MNEMTARAVDGIQHHVGASSWLVEMSWAVGALAMVVVLGGLKVYTPLDGDQALFLYTAQSIDAGGVLYVDVWDLKQPGIFWFYGAAGPEHLYRRRSPGPDVQSPVAASPGPAFTPGL
jgi:hypothetical protein